MHFVMKRFVSGLSRRRAWFWAVVVVPMAYLSWSAVQPDRYSVSQSISISPSAPVALSSTPGDVKSVKELVANPTEFFQNNYAVRKLYANIHAGMAVSRADEQFRRLIETVKNDMSLTIQAENLVELAYHGKDQPMGRTLVAFYAQRLVQKADEGLARDKQLRVNGPLPKLAGTQGLSSHRALWRGERLIPLVGVSGLCLLCVLALLTALEWSDPTLKSERQVARYLGGIPILGSLPDLNRVAVSLQNKD